MNNSDSDSDTRREEGNTDSVEGMGKGEKTFKDKSLNCFLHLRWQYEF